MSDEIKRQVQNIADIAVDNRDVNNVEQCCKMLDEIEQSLSAIRRLLYKGNAFNTLKGE